MEKFHCKTKIISGPGALSALGTLKAKRAFLVADPFFQENGTVERVLQALGAEEHQVFSRIAPDPTVELAAEGTALVRAFRPDWVVALGGGSTMDCAKAMNHFSGTGAKLAAIPTTSGSGSEVTDFAILTHNHVKHPLVDARLRPDVAILDGSLLDKLPGRLVAEGGFDLVCHSLEAYVARDAGTITDCLAEEAFRTAYANLPASYAGSTQVRPRIHMAATMAAMAFSQAGLGLCHAMAHSLGGEFHVSHGTLNAILLPAVVELNAHVCAGKYAAMARAAGLSGSGEAIGLRNLKNGLVRLRRDLGLPGSLAQAGIPKERIWEKMDALVEAALADPCCKTNPLTPEPFMVRRILEGVC